MKKFKHQKMNSSDESKDNYLIEFIFELKSGKTYEDYYGDNNSEFISLHEYEYYHETKTIFSNDIDLNDDDWWY